MQLINLAYAWNRLPVIDHTWPNMKIHLCDTQDNLSALPTASAMYHQQNHFLHQVNIATMADMVAQLLMENQAHH
jgi:hypothetical protein